MSEAIMELPNAEPVEPVEQEITETTEGEQSAEQGSSESSAQQGAGEIDPKLPLWKQSKEAIKEIQAKNPALAGRIKAALIADSNLQREFPGGVKEVVAIKTAFDQLGGDESLGKTPDQIVHEVVEERNYWRDFDAKISNADPAAINMFAEAAPDSFIQLGPAIFNKFAEMNGEGFASYVSQVAINSMNTAELPVQFAILRSFVPQLPDGPAKDQVINAFNAIMGWVDGLKQNASKPVTPAKTAKSQENQPTAEQLQQSKLQATAAQWNSQAVSDGLDIFNDSLSAIQGSNKLTPQQRKDIKAKTVEELVIRLKADPKYRKDQNAYLQNGNREAYIRRMNSERRKIIPTAIRRAYDEVAGMRSAVKVAPKPVDAKQSVSKGTSAAAASTGFTRISSYPAGKVDLMRTTQKMMSENKYILKDGTKVQWVR